MKKTLTVITALLSTNAIAENDTYRVEVNAGLHLFVEALTSVGTEENEIIGEHEEVALSVGGTFYLSPVNTTLGAYDEAPFLSKASSIGFSYGKEAEGKSVPYGRYIGFGGKSKTLKSRAIVDNYIFQFTYIDDNLDNLNYKGDVEQEHIILGFGGYMTDYSTVVVSYVNYQDTRQFIDALPLGATYRQDEGVDVAVKYYIPFENGQSISVGANLLIVDTKIRVNNASGTRYALGGNINYFPTHQWALSAAFEYGEFSDNGFDLKRSALHLNTKYYFTNSFSMNLALTQMGGTDEFRKIDVDDVTGGNFSLGFTGRF